MKLDAGGSQKYLRPLEGFKSIKPLHDDVLVVDMNFEAGMSGGGIFLLGDDGKQRGLRARWGLIYETGPEQTDVKKGQWVLVEHGRWTRGVQFINQDGEKQTLRKIDPACMLLISDDDPRGYIETLNSDEVDTGPGVTHRPEDFGAGR